MVHFASLVVKPASSPTGNPASSPSSSVVNPASSPDFSVGNPPSLTASFFVCLSALKLHFQLPSRRLSSSTTSLTCHDYYYDNPDEKMLLFCDVQSHCSQLHNLRALLTTAKHCPSTPESVLTFLSELPASVSRAVGAMTHHLRDPEPRRDSDLCRWSAWAPSLSSSL